MPHHRAGATAVLLLLIPCASLAQSNTQICGRNFTFDWVKSHELTIGVNANPRCLVSAPAGDPGWATLDVTPSIEYSRGQWFDMVTEMLVGRTKQTDDLEFHRAHSTDRRSGCTSCPTSASDIVKERRPKRRLVLRDLAAAGVAQSATTRPTSPTRRPSVFATGSKCLWPINRPRITDNGAVYLAADWEWFIPLDDPDERFANRQRVRAGIGYRRSCAWRFEARYVWNRSRNTIDEPFTSTDHAVDLTMKRVW